MSEQLSLPGMSKQPQEMHRLFLALFPDAQTAAHIGQLAQQVRDKHGMRGKPRPTDHFHVTLHFCGDFPQVPEALVRAISMAAAKTAATMPPFEVSFDRVKSFANKASNRPCVLLDDGSNAALREFHRNLVTAFGKARGGQEPRFTPHITLLYDDHVVAEELVNPVSWTVSEFVLVHSCKGCYNSLGHWALRG